MFPETIQLSSSISNSCLKAEAWWWGSWYFASVARMTLTLNVTIRVKISLLVSETSWLDSAVKGGRLTGSQPAWPVGTFYSCLSRPLTQSERGGRSDAAVKIPLGVRQGREWRHSFARRRFPSRVTQRALFDLSANCLFDLCRLQIGDICKRHARTRTHTRTYTNTHGEICKSSDSPKRNHLLDRYDFAFTKLHS